MKFIKIRKSILLLFIISCVTLLFSGYVNKNTDIYSLTEKSEIKIAKDSEEETTEIKTIEPPEDGWTLEQLNKVIYINNVNYNYPISLKDLGKNYSSDDNLILYKNEVAFGGSINTDGTYNSLSFAINSNYSILNNKSLININGITLESDMQELFLKMGEPNVITDNELTRIIYNVENLNIIFILNKEMKISFISLLWEE